MAPPHGLSRSGSAWKARFHISGMAANASLHSMASNCSTFIPDRSSRRSVAGTGADSTMAASSAATVAWANRPRMGRPSRSANERSAMSMAAAPSVIWEELPAVMSGRGVRFPVLRRRQSGHGLHRAAAADALVFGQRIAGEGTVLPLDGHRNRLGGEAAGVPCGRRPTMALEGVQVHLLTADVPPVGQDLGHPELGPQAAVDGIEERRGERPGSAAGIGGQRYPAHRLDPAGHHQVVVAGLYAGSGEVHGLLGRAALAVDGGGRHVSGEARPPPRRCGSRWCSARPPG
jgi:hypothetical protein